MECWDKDHNIYEKNLFGSCEKTLNELSDERIFNIDYVEFKNQFQIREMCDEHFLVILTPEMCKDLSELFAKIGEKIKEGEPCGNNL